jgi:hypothetical protein
MYIIQLWSLANKEIARSRFKVPRDLIRMICTMGDLRGAGYSRLIVSSIAKNDGLMTKSDRRDLVLTLLGRWARQS